MPEAHRERRLAHAGLAERLDPATVLAELLDAMGVPAATSPVAT